MKIIGTTFITIKKINFLSLKLIFAFNLETIKKNITKKGINITICFPKKINGKSKCFLIYVTSLEQANYLSKKENRLNDFFNLPTGQTLQINSDYVKNHVDTFVNAASTYGIHECKILSYLNMDLENSHYVRIFEIQVI